ncbi:MAG: hypothetical protein HQK53_12795 [Oligoflexia bacterium]|nr:hypothetical protein [Oligoflexia bacterium]
MRKILSLLLLFLLVSFYGCGSDGSAPAASTSTALPSAKIGCGSTGTESCVK